MPAMKGLDPANLRANLRKTTPDPPRKVCYTIISYVCVCVCVRACLCAGSPQLRYAEVDTYFCNLKSLTYKN